MELSSGGVGSFPKKSLGMNEIKYVDLHKNIFPGPSLMGMELADRFKYQKLF